jgi:hypothetical protein
VNLQQHLTDEALQGEISSFVYMAFFYTNLPEFYPPRFEGDTLVFPIYLPGDFRAPFVDPLTATGPAVMEIFSSPDIYTLESRYR